MERGKRTRSTLGGCRGARPLAWEGLFQSIGQGLGETYLSAFALWLQAGPLVVGLAAAIPTAGMALAQLVADRARRTIAGARAFIARAWVLQALAYASLGSCVLVSPETGAIALCALAFVTWGLAGITVPAWTALVARVVPRDRQGAFFAQRGTAQQVGVLAAMLGGGWLLARAQAHAVEGLGFVLLFAAAGFFRAAGVPLLAAVPDSGPVERVRPVPDALHTLRSSRQFRRLAFYLWGLHFGTNVASPFFVPYMLRELGMSYALVGVLVAVPVLVKALTLNYWGRLADRVGPGPLFRTAGWLVVPVAALWLVSGSPWWIACAQVYSGLAWGAFELAQASSILRTTRGRETTVAFLNLVDGLTMIGGALFGGVLVALLDGLGRSGYLGVFAASSAMRALPAAVLLWRIRGIGRPGWSHGRMPLRLWSVRPTRGLSLRPLGGLPSEGEERGEEDREA